MGSQFTKAQKMKLAGSLVPVVLLGFVVILVIGLYFRSSMGWFANNKQVSGTGMSAQIEADALPEMSAWRFDMTETIGEGNNVDENGDTLNKAGAWVDALDSQTSTSPKGILPAVEYTYGQNESGEKFRFRSLHLGTVDNLLTLNDDNCFYIRFDVTDPIYRTTVSYSLANGNTPATSGVKIYGREGDDLTSTVAALEDDNHNSLNALATFAEIFSVDVAVSTTQYTPASNKADIDALFDSDSRLTNLEDEDGEELDLGEQSGAYYIYIRFSPNLDKCFDATASIVAYMPCEVTFDVTLTVMFN